MLIAALRMLGRTVIGFVDPFAPKKLVLGVKHLGDDRMVLRYRNCDIALVNGVGSVGSCVQRSQLYRKFKKNGFRFARVVHPNAFVAGDTVLGEGVQIMAGALIQTGSHVGGNAIVNTGAVVDHDCSIGAHSHIAPGAVLSGQVRTGTGVHVGTGARIIQCVSVGPWSIVGAGAVVIRNVPARTTAVGVPAKWPTIRPKS